MTEIWLILCAAGIPTAATTFGFWLLRRTIAKREATSQMREANAQAREAARQKKDILIMKGINASIALSEATAEALRKGKCNGEMDAALEYAREVKHEQKDFLLEEAMKNIY